MPQTLCARCRNAIAASEGSLSFCPYCGAPQIFLSEELREQAAEQAEQYAQSQRPQTAAPASAPAIGGEVVEDGPEGTHIRPRKPAAPVAPGVDLNLIQWPAAIRSAGTLALVAGGLALLSLPVALVGGLAFLWAMAAPVLTVHLYRERAPGARISPAYGARLGLVTALLIAAITATVNVGGLVVNRFVTHTAGALDAAITASMADTHSRLVAQMGEAGAAPALQLFSVPEFRVGATLTGVAIFTLLYLGLASLMGMTAGNMRTAASRR